MSEGARPHVEASRRVAAIMRAAEDAATEIRAEAERRADARIAEAARAADIRVTAAEDEAEEILGEARAEAAAVTEAASADAQRLREDARSESTRIVIEARDEASEVQRIAEVFAAQTREDAETSARKQLGRARELAAEVLQDGTDMSQHLHQLADSLRRNAELLLRDVGAAHHAMTDKLDQAGVDLGEPQRSSRPRAAAIGDVPEFIPRSPR
jgi:cell division septum initiation protein DivIVA